MSAGTFLSYSILSCKPPARSNLWRDRGWHLGSISSGLGQLV